MRSAAPPVFNSLHVRRCSGGFCLPVPRKVQNNRTARPRIVKIARLLTSSWYTADVQNPVAPSHSESHLDAGRDFSNSDLARFVTQKQGARPLSHDGLRNLFRCPGVNMLHFGSARYTAHTGNDHIGDSAILGTRRPAGSSIKLAHISVAVLLSYWGFVSRS